MWSEGGENDEGGSQVDGSERKISSEKTPSRKCVDVYIRWGREEKVRLPAGRDYGRIHELWLTPFLGK